MQTILLCRKKLTNIVQALYPEINGMQLKEPTCKELRIWFSSTYTKLDFEPIIINDKEIEVFSQAKLLGLTFLSISNGTVI